MNKKTKNNFDVRPFIFLLAGVIANIASIAVTVYIGWGALSIWLMLVGFVLTSIFWIKLFLYFIFSLNPKNPRQRKKELWILLSVGIIIDSGFFYVSTDKGIVSEFLSITEKCKDNEYKDEKHGVSFYCPHGWSIQPYSATADHIVAEHQLTSAGDNILISIFDINNLGSQYAPVSKILDGSDKKITYKDVKAVKIAGINGASYKEAGASENIVSVFEKSGRQYHISFYDSDGDGNLEIYQKIVASFKLLE